MRKTSGISINDLARKSLQHTKLAQQLEQNLSLDEFLSLVAETCQHFIKTLFNESNDPNLQLFGKDQEIVNCLSDLFALDKDNRATYFASEFYRQGKTKLHKAMTYSLLSKGKMFRPALVFAVGSIFEANLEDLLIASVAVEAIHAYSLIHDDLPAMDDDDLRRGEPTNHIVFGEAHAILAGDALQSLAFSLLSSNENLPAQQIVKQVQVLAYGAGHYGMCLGQSYDLLSEESPTLSGSEDLSHLESDEQEFDEQKSDKPQLDLVLDEESKQRHYRELVEIHYRKTAFLIRSSALLGFYAGRDYQRIELVDEISSWAYSLGLAFQIKDDLLDVEGDQELIGKPVGSDTENHKLTFTSLLGIINTKAELAKQRQNAFRNLGKFTAGRSKVMVKLLEDLTNYVVKRNK